jgi:hypothetical protein
VLTQPKDHEVKVAVIKATWGKRFDNILFMSTVEGKVQWFIFFETEKKPTC